MFRAPFDFSFAFSPRPTDMCVRACGRAAGRACVRLVPQVLSRLGVNMAVLDAALGVEQTGARVLDAGLGVEQTGARGRNARPRERASWSLVLCP
jgi:hypothetical protein